MFKYRKCFRHLLVILNFLAYKITSLIKFDFNEIPSILVYDNNSPLLSEILVEKKIIKEIDLIKISEPILTSLITSSLPSA